MAVSIKGKGKYISRRRRHMRLRKKISGTPQRPRLVVTRSNRHIVAQIIDDEQGHTLVSASSMEEGIQGDKTAQAKQVGERVAQRATEANITTVVFDRGGNKYHGRIAALAEGARESGLSL